MAGFFDDLAATPAPQPQDPAQAGTPGYFDDLMSSPAASSPNPYAGQTLSAAPDRGWLGTADDIVRMSTNKIPFSDRLSAGLDTFFGTGLPGADYAKNLQNERWKDEALAEQHPWLSKVLGYTGGGAAALATLPADVVAGGATMLGKTLSGAGTGVVFGAAQSASDTPDLTNLPDAATRIGTGAAVGGMLGGAVPLAAAGIGKAYSAAAGALDGGAPGISRAAQKPLLTALQADGPANVQATVSGMGPQGMLADAGGSMLGTAQGAISNSPDARSILAKALTDRAAGANARINDAVDTNFGPAEDPLLVSKAILDHRSAVDNQNYPPALGNAPPVDASSVVDTVDRMLDSSAPGTMVNKALNNVRSMLTEDREVPSLDANGQPVPGFGGVPQTEIQTLPIEDAQKLHAVKQELDNVINYDAPGLGVPAGALANQQGALKYIRGQLNAELENQVPGYAQANAASSALAKRADAVKLGTSVLDSGKTAMTPANLAQQFGAMEPGEQIALAKGTRGEIDRILDTRANDLVAGNNIIKGEGDWNRARLSTIFGDAPTNAVINAVGNEARYAKTSQDLIGGAQTELRRSAAATMRAPDASGHPLINPDSTLSGVGMTLAKKGFSALANALRTDPTSSYGEVANVLSAQGPQRDAYLKALAAALERNSAYAATGQKVGNRAALAAALGGGQYLDDRLQQR